jgi:hypothetical protein
MPEIFANIQKGKYEDVLAAVQSPIIALTELVKNASDSSLSKDDPIIIRINSVDSIITIDDSGEGFSKEELDHLGEAGFSSKIIGNKTLSSINITLAGNKGLGLLTAFFISDLLEIETFSQNDQKAYYLVWKKGEQKYQYHEIDRKTLGTTITLRHVSSEKLQLILLPEEKTKLFMASLKFFTGSIDLPKIRLFIDEVEESHYPKIAIEDYYKRNKGPSGAFIAKANFKYYNNKVYLSYEDNISRFYTFTDKLIDLTDISTVDSFVRDIKAPDKGPYSIKVVGESELFRDKFLSVSVPSFSGVLYTWRNRKHESLDQWPVGIRIYINNYSLYKYLDKEND